MSIKTKLLFISWVIPPSRGGSAYITHQLAKLFDSMDLVIVGGSTKPFQGIKKYDGIDYHYFFTEFNWQGHGDRYFSFFRWMTFPFFLFNLIRLTIKEKPDAIFATFPDGYYLLAAWLISFIFKIKLFTYYHNTYTENRKGLSKWFANKIQYKVFCDSKIIFLISEGMLDYYKMNYPEWAFKFEVLPHTFDQYPLLNDSTQTIQHQAPYQLVMIGTFNQSNMEATARLFRLIAKYPELYQLDIYTSTSKQILKFKWGLDLDLLGIHYMGLVKQEEVNKILTKYDACLMTHGFTGEYTKIEYQTIFPTRTIPLLLSGKPILVHSPEHSFLNRFIRTYDCAELVAEKSDTALITALEKITADPIRIQQLFVNAKKASDYFYGPEIIKSLNKSLIARINTD